MLEMVQVIVCKCDLLKGAMECFKYAIEQGARIINCSWGVSAPQFGFPDEDKEKIRNLFKYLEDKETIVVAAAGNNSWDMDDKNTLDNSYYQVYPACLSLPQVIAVAATTKTGSLRKLSNFGKKTVHLAAPGEDIWTTQMNSKYGTDSGTSLAASHVTAALALMMIEFPYLSKKELIDRLLNTVDKDPQLKEKLISGGHLNLARALASLDDIRNYDLQQCTERLEKEAKIADEWVQEAARDAWKTIDENLRQKAISRIEYAEKAWRKVGAACERGIQLFQDGQSDQGEIDDQLNQPKNKNSWKEKFEEAENNQSSWEARILLYEAKLARNHFLHSANDFDVNRMKTSFCRTEMELYAWVLFEKSTRNI